MPWTIWITDEYSALVHNGHYSKHQSYQAYDIQQYTEVHRVSTDLQSNLHLSDWIFQLSKLEIVVLGNLGNLGNSVTVVSNNRHSFYFLCMSIIRKNRDRVTQVSQNYKNFESYSYHLHDLLRNIIFICMFSCSLNRIRNFQQNQRQIGPFFWLAKSPPHQKGLLV